MASILSRLAGIQKQLEQEGSGKITVTFKDGHMERLTGGACVDLVLNAADSVARFEARGTGHGMLPDLLNNLLEE